MMDSERPTDEIEPMVPELSTPVRTDGGERPSRRRRIDQPEADDAEAPLVPDLS